MKNGFLFSILLLLATAAAGQERILDFQSTVVVNKDRSVDVTEVIIVKVDGINIQRGIFRDIITVMVNDRGRKKQLKLVVSEVLKNGEAENFVVDGINNVQRIKIGNADILLTPDVYTYTIKYNLEQQVRFFDGYDEVYWNATGNEWQFQIDKASVKIVLPDEAVISQHAGYSGSSGETGCACTFDLLSPNSINYSMTSELYAYQGITVAVGWQKGVIEAPSQAEVEKEKFDENKGIFYGEIGLGILGLYLLAAWFFVGRDPEREAIIPRFDPPQGYSPAACRYVLRMGFDNKAFTASIINMAVKGFLVIDKSGKKYVLRKVSESTDKLTDGEKKVAISLFSNKSEVILGDSYDSTLSSAINYLELQLKKDFLKINFKKNSGLMIPAIILGIAIWFTVIGNILDSEELFIPIIIASFIMIVAVPTIISSVRSFRNAAGYRKILAAIPIAFSVGIFVVAPLNILISFDLLTQEIIMIYAPYILIFLGIIGLIALFFYLMQAPTVFGRKRMDEIEGLKMFMEVAEKHRFNSLTTPEKTPQLFERLLPYAIALGVENAWGKQFDSIIERAIQNNEYKPTWYVGDSRSMFNVAAISSNLGSSMSSAVSTSSTPPSSSGSSGSSGGGSSGGGGGGGGGGGW